MYRPWVSGAAGLFAASLAILLLALVGAPEPPPSRRPAQVEARALTSRPDFIEISIELPELKVTPCGSGERIELSGFTDFMAVDGAELPVIRRFVAVPECERVVMHVEANGVEKIAGVTVRPPTDPTGGPGHLGNSNAWARVVDIQHARGQALARIEIQPVRYNRTTRQISYPRELRLKIRPVAPRGPVGVNVGPFQAALRAVVPNLKDFAGGAATYGPDRLTTQAVGQVCWCPTGDDDWEAASQYVNTYCAPDYLIIVADELLTDAVDSSLVDSLATKRAVFNGFNVAIARMGQIDSTPDKTATPPLIRNFVKSVYDSASAAHMGDGRLGFLLLVGDALNPSDEVILPPSSYWTEWNEGSDADLVNFDGVLDFIPDVLVGRLTVDADDADWELENVIGKTTSYEPIGASAGWTDDILLMSGGSDAGFTFVGEGLTGFQNYFDAIEGLAPPGAANFVQMHRLAAASDSLFSKAVCDEIAAGYSVVGLFDHANAVNFANAFFPVHYDTLRNNESPSLVLSFGSYSGYFDRVGADEGCCPDPSYGGIPCKCPDTSIDPCDALAERLLVQPAGAIGVIAYSRTNSPTVVQQVFANVFRSLFQHKLGDLGSLVLATKLLSADQTTTLALNLLGDPALSIDYQFDSVPQDSIDLAVSGLDMEFISGRHDYASSSSEQSVSVVVANKWKDSAVSVPVEIWRGVPDGSGSVLLNSFTIASLSGHSDTTWTGSIGSFAVGDYDIYATADPDNRLDDPVPTNNVSYRTLHVRDYAPGFPIAASGNRAEVMDAVIGSPRKLEIAAGDSLYSSDGMNLGRVGTGPAGNLFRSEKRYVVSIGLLVGEYQYLKVSEAGGTWQSFFWVPPSVSDIIALDHGRPDSMLVALNGAQYPDRMIRLYTVAGQPKWTRAIGGAAGGTLALSSFAMAAGDITGDGVSDVVYVLNPTTGVGADSLGVIDGKTGSRVWAISTSDEQLERVRVRLVDIENDGALEIVVNSRLGSPVEDRIQCFSASGSLLWQVTGGQAPAPPLLFAPADINHDGVKEIVFACGQRVGIISVSGTSAIVSCEITLTGYRVFNSTPLAIDIDGDDLLEFILFSRVQDHYLNVYSLEMRVYDSDLTLLGSPTVFPWGVNLLGPIDASAGDIDGDGIVEVVFITPDQTLHAVRVGSVTGRGDWTSADGDAMRTGLYEQVIAGSYAEHLAVQGRARVLDDAALSQGLTVTGPADLQVSALDSIVVETSFSLLGSEHDSVRVRIDELASPESYWGGFYFGNGTSRGKVEHAVVTGALTGFEHSSALQITGSRISDVSATGIVSADSLWLVASTVSGASGNGLELGLGTVATIDGSVVENVDGSGLVCDSCSAASKLKNSTIRGSGLHGAYLQRVHGISVESSVFENNASAGIRFESADGLVTQCRSEGNAGGVVCFDHSNPVVEESKVDQNQGGVAAVENSYPIVGYGSIGGRDCITNSTGYHVSNLSSGWIYAHHDYWGSACCKTSKFFGNVSCDSCETAAVCQGAGGMAVSPPAEPVSNSVSPSAFDLVSAAPNPFNPNVRIRFAVPSGGASVQLTVYNVRGQRVAVLQDGVVPPGYHERTWSGVDIRGESVATGVYFVRMESAGFQEVMKIVLLK